MSFESLGLSEPIVRAVHELGYTDPTPIQKQAIPAVLNGGDLLAGAQTGTGKTAGFTLPILERLAASHRASPNPPRGLPAGRGTSSGAPPKGTSFGAPVAGAGKRAVRALVLTPTRELAAQVEESVRAYGKYLSLKSTVLFGGVGIHPQIDALKRGVDIVVATPGRLLDHMQQKTIDVSHLEILVLDEADRMLDMGFIHDIKRVLAKLPSKRQNLLFSATFSDEIKALADSLLDAPALIEVARRNTTAELVSQKVYPVDRDRKRELLTHLIRLHEWSQVLVFTRTKHGANRLAEQLTKDGISALAIHGNKSQSARTRALAEFKDGTLQVLVATDIAARGIDIDQLPHVVNYDLPNVPEDYVHRIGRTGRAGASGEAVSLVCVDEHQLLKDIEKLIKRSVPQEVIPGFEPDLNAKPEPIQLRSRGQGGGRQPRATAPKAEATSTTPAKPNARARNTTSTTPARPREASPSASAPRGREGDKRNAPRNDAKRGDGAGANGRGRNERGNGAGSGANPSEGRGPAAPGSRPSRQSKGGDNAAREAQPKERQRTGNQAAPRREPRPSNTDEGRRAQPGGAPGKPSSNPGALLGGKPR